MPHHFRGIVWQLLCNAHISDAKESYAEYLKMTSPYEKVIRRDITRTYPEHDFFKEKNGLGQESLFNVMKVRYPTSKENDNYPHPALPFYLPPVSPYLSVPLSQHSVCFSFSLSIFIFPPPSLSPFFFLSRSQYAFLPGIKLDDLVKVDQV